MRIIIDGVHYRVRFGGTNAHVGSWDVYVAELRGRGNAYGFVGKANKGPRNVWYAMGEVESGPYQTRHQAAAQLIRDKVDRLLRQGWIRTVVEPSLR